MMLIDPKVILQNPKTMKIHATSVFNWNLKLELNESKRKHCTKTELDHHVAVLFDKLTFVFGVRQIRKNMLGK